MAIKVKTLVDTSTLSSVSEHFAKIDEATNTFLASLHWSQVRDVNTEIFESTSGGRSWVVRTIVYSEEVLAQMPQPRPSIPAAS